MFVEHIFRFQKFPFVSDISLHQLLHQLDRQPYFAFTHDFAKLKGYQGFESYAASATVPFLLLNKSAGNEPELSLAIQTLANHDRPVFVFWGYDLKNRLERLPSEAKPFHHFPDLLAFEAETVVDFSAQQLQIGELIESRRTISLQCSIDREAYLQQVKAIQELIKEGEVYELNYCMHFLSENAQIDPVDLFCRLVKASPMPFCGLYKLNGQYILSASPERFLRYDLHRVISQPIKGTVSSQKAGSVAEARQMLTGSEKETAENLMIVDLVRNDLNRLCRAGSVEVDELFGVYEFPGLYHMISTISGEPEKPQDAIQCLLNSFPMGSMTGAPKISAMTWIDRLETHARGPFSGSIGYLLPDGSFDFNVLIRSIFYDENRGLLSYSSGSAITIDSDPEQEYEECLLKAEKIKNLLENFT